MDTTSELLALRAAGNQQLATLAVMRRTEQMEQALVRTIEASAAKPPAPPGQGRHVDKQA
jgi:DNA-binding FadR family transcriptional regulator